MFRLIKWAFVALSVFAIVTASDEQQAAMMAGARAFGGALLTACSRQGGACTTAIGVMKSTIVDAWQASRDEPREQAMPGNARYQLSPEEPRDELTYSRQYYFNSWRLLSGPACWVWNRSCYCAERGFERAFKSIGVLDLEHISSLKKLRRDG